LCVTYRKGFIVRLKLLLPVSVIALLMAISQGCAPLPTVTAKPKPKPAASRPGRPRFIAASSPEAPRAGPAGNVILNWTLANQNPQLELDGQRRLNLFFDISTSAEGSSYAQAQLNADGTWTKPAAASPEFQFLANLTALPDVSGRAVRAVERSDG
jgi:hypothetical protein